MTGQDFQDKVDALVRDLQTSGKGQAVEVMFRQADNTNLILPLSSTPAGVVNVGELAAIQQEVDTMKLRADSYATNYAPVQAASEAFKTAQIPHEALIETARVARVNLQTALDADPDYQTAKTALDDARGDADYIASAADYKRLNVSENYTELQSAKGKYIAP